MSHEKFAYSLDEKLCGKFASGSKFFEKFALNHTTHFSSIENLASDN